MHARFWSARGQWHAQEKATRLEELLKERDVELSQGEGPKSVNASLSLGFLAMHNGLEMSLDAYREFLEKVSGDHGVADTIQEAFVLAARSVGIPFGEPIELKIDRRTYSVLRRAQGGLSIKSPEELLVLKALRDRSFSYVSAETKDGKIIRLDAGADHKNVRDWSLL